MTEKRSILLLASAAALTLVLHESALSAPPVDKPTLSTADSTFTAEPTTATSPIPGPTSKIEKTPDADKSTFVRSKTTPTASSEQDATAPRTSMPRTRRGRPGRMTAKERNARWEQRFQKMRERAMQRNREIQETTKRWDSYWKTLDAMTMEQKEAIYAIFGHGQRRYSPRTMDYRTPPAMPMPPRSGQPEFDSFFPKPGHDYGYGPRRMQPHPFKRNPGPFFGK